VWLVIEFFYFLEKIFCSGYQDFILYIYFFAPSSFISNPLYQLAFCLSHHHLLSLIGEAHRSGGGSSLPPRRIQRVMVAAAPEAPHGPTPSSPLHGSPSGGADLAMVAKLQLARAGMLLGHAAPPRAPLCMAHSAAAADLQPLHGSLGGGGGAPNRH